MNKYLSVSKDYLKVAEMAEELLADK